VDGTSFSDRKIWELSQGERQRVFIARSLATESPILLLDEPASNLDVRHRIDLWELIRQLAKDGKTVIVSHHDLSFSLEFFDDVAIFHQGGLVYHGPCDGCLTPNILRDVFGVARGPDGRLYPAPSP
jgi:iron complex transport system ATP-binding protein